MSLTNAPLQNANENDSHVFTPPRSLSDLFWGFSMLSMQGFGGVMAIAQRELVERRRWFSREDFLEDWAVAQVLPGPNVANLSVIIGDRYQGTRGACVALLGLFLFPLVIIALLAIAFTSFQHLPVIQGALKGMGLVVVALILTTALKLIPVLRTHVGGRAFCVISAVSTFVAVALLRFPLLWVLLIIGTLSCLWTYHRIITHPSAENDSP